MDDLAPLIATARAAWPGVALADDVLTARLTEVLARGDTPAAELHVADLYLATACLAGVPAAIAALERVLADVPGFLARFRRGGDFADEIVQRLRERLLVGAPGDETPRPRLGDYGGRGPLRAWLRVAATRLALDRIRERDGDHDLELMSDDGAIDVTAPEHALLRARHKDAVAAAMAAAITALTAKQRNLLRMHHVDGVTLDRLATAYRVHRATVARWLAEARDEVMTRTCDRLAEELAASPSEAASVIGVVRDQLSLSLSRLFG